jgi:hypothetical protein
MKPELRHHWHEETYEMPWMKQPGLNRAGSVTRHRIQQLNDSPWKIDIIAPTPIEHSIENSGIHYKFQYITMLKKCEFLSSPTLLSH